jgi:hypothetical protein
MAAPPTAAAPANSTKVPAAAVPVSTVAHSNSLPMSLSCLGVEWFEPEQPSTVKLELKTKPRMAFMHG